MKKIRTPTFLFGALAGAVVALVLALTMRSAEAQRVLGPYMIMHHENPTAIPGVFRVNQTTGAMSYCYVTGNGAPQVACTAEVP